MEKVLTGVLFYTFSRVTTVLFYTFLASIDIVMPQNVKLRRLKSESDYKTNPAFSESVSAEDLVARSLPNAVELDATVDNT